MNRWLELYDKIEEKPGLTMRQLARLLNWNRSTVEGRLASMETQTTLRVSESEDGKLFPYSRNGVLSGV